MSRFFSFFYLFSHCADLLWTTFRSVFSRTTRPLASPTPTINQWESTAQYSTAKTGLQATVGWSSTGRWRHSWWLTKDSVSMLAKCKTMGTSQVVFMQQETGGTNQFTRASILIKSSNSSGCGITTSSTIIALTKAGIPIHLRSAENYTWILSTMKVGSRLIYIHPSNTAILIWSSDVI